MKSGVIYKITIVLLNIILFGNNLNAQNTTSKVTFENVSSIKLSDFDGMKDGEKHKWTAKNGNTYEIKFENGNKTTWIEYGKKMVKHGAIYKYGKSWGSDGIKFLKEKTNYRYGKKHGQSEIYYMYNKKRYLTELINYQYGLRNGVYVKYGSNDNIETSGKYSNGIKKGLWTHYYSDGMIMYEYNYNGLTGIRDSYGGGSETVKNSRKANLLSKAMYRYFINDGKGKWRKHGLYIVYNTNGTTKERYYYNGDEVSHENFKQKPNPKGNNTSIYCAKEAKEIRNLIKSIKPSNDEAKVIIREVEMICVYLENIESETTPLLKELLLKLKNTLRHKKFTSEHIKLIMKYQKSVCIGKRG